MWKMLNQIKAEKTITQIEMSFLNFSLSIVFKSTPDFHWFFNVTFWIVMTKVWCVRTFFNQIKHTKTKRRINSQPSKIRLYFFLLQFSFRVKKKQYLTTFVCLFTFLFANKSLIWPMKILFLKKSWQISKKVHRDIQHKDCLIF